MEPHLSPLAHLAVIWCGVFVAIVAARRTRLTPVLYYLAVGAILVNIGVLPSESRAFIRGFAEVGIVLIMFALGFRESTINFVAGIRRSWGVAFFGGVAPFLTGYFVADYFWGDTDIALICGLAMTATSVSLAMVSLKAENLNGSRAATGIRTSAVLEDVASLALVAVLVPLATGDAEPGLASISAIIGKALVFFAIVVVFGTIILPHERISWLARIPIIGRIGVKHLFAFGEGEHATLAALTIAATIGVIAHLFGFHPAVGAYMAGLILKEEYFHFHDHPRVNYYENTRRIVDNVAFSWIGPVFFVDLGSKIVFDWDVVVAVIPATIALTVGMLVAQIVSSSVSARYTGGFTWNEGLMMGFGMLGRAEIAFVVMDIAFVQNPILSQEAFYTLMFTCFWLNVAVPVTLAWWKPYYTGEKHLKGG